MGDIWGLVILSSDPSGVSARLRNKFCTKGTSNEVEALQRGRGRVSSQCMRHSCRLACDQGQPSRRRCRAFVRAQRVPTPRHERAAGNPACRAEVQELGLQRGGTIRIAKHRVPVTPGLRKLRIKARHSRVPVHRLTRSAVVTEMIQMPLMQEALCLSS